MTRDRITHHALDRYRERVGPLPPLTADAKQLLFDRIFDEAKPKHLRRFLNDRRRTAMIMLHDCVLVANKGWVVTVLTYDQFAKGHGWKPEELRNA